MSVISCKVYKDKIEIASDSIIVKGYTQNKSINSFAKLFEINDMVIGSVGTTEESSLLKIFCSTRKPASASETDILLFLSEFAEWKRNKTGNYNIDNNYIFIFNGKVFCVESFFIEEITDYMAIGAGRDYALTALYLGSDVIESVKVACELSIYCEEPITKKTVKRCT